MYMFAIKPLPEFTAWLDGLADSAVRGMVVARVKRPERGLMGDVESVGEAISELRIHPGAGWRVYFTQRDTQMIVLLAGGSKRTEEGRYQACQGAGGIAGLTGEKLNMTKRIKVADLPDFDAAPISTAGGGGRLSDRYSGGETTRPCRGCAGRHRPRPRHERDCQGIRIDCAWRRFTRPCDPCTTALDTIEPCCAALGVRLVAQPGAVFDSSAPLVVAARKNSRSGANVKRMVRTKLMARSGETALVTREARREVLAIASPGRSPDRLHVSRRECSINQAMEFAITGRASA